MRAHRVSLESVIGVSCLRDRWAALEPDDLRPQVRLRCPTSERPRLCLRAIPGLGIRSPPLRLGASHCRKLRAQYVFNLSEAHRDRVGVAFLEVLVQRRVLGGYGARGSRDGGRAGGRLGLPNPPPVIFDPGSYHRLVLSQTSAFRGTSVSMVVKRGERDCSLLHTQRCGTERMASACHRVSREARY